jgi:hypothetical protein
MMGKLAEVTAVSTDTMVYLGKQSKESSAWASGAPAAGSVRQLTPAALPDLWALWSELSRAGYVNHK